MQRQSIGTPIRYSPHAKSSSVKRFTSAATGTGVIGRREQRPRRPIEFLAAKRRNARPSHAAVPRVTPAVARGADIRSMSHRAIDRSEWTSFVDAFSRRHDGWLVSVAVEEAPAARRYVAHDVPLRGVVAELDEDIGSMMVFTGDVAPHSTHFVGHAAGLEVEETGEGADAALTITDESGMRTIVELRSPMRPELVDGIA